MRRREAEFACVERGWPVRAMVLLDKAQEMFDAPFVFRVGGIVLAGMRLIEAGAERQRRRQIGIEQVGAVAAVGLPFRAQPGKGERHIAAIVAAVETGETWRRHPGAETAALAGRYSEMRGENGKHEPVDITGKTEAVIDCWRHGDHHPWANSVRRVAEHCVARSAGNVQDLKEALVTM
ncbi:hypothetical protein D9M72_553810 [compost metagenome]